MDDLLEELARRAQEGDLNALYELLIHKVILNDFDLEHLIPHLDLLSDHQKYQLALALTRSLPSSMRSGVYLEGDVAKKDWFPKYQGMETCPRGHPYNRTYFTYVHLVWELFDFDIHPEGLLVGGEVDDSRPYILVDDDPTTNDLGQYILCETPLDDGTRCGATWYPAWSVEY